MEGGRGRGPAMTSHGRRETVGTLMSVPYSARRPAPPGPAPPQAPPRPKASPSFPAPSEVGAGAVRAGRVLGHQFVDAADEVALLGAALARLAPLVQDPPQLLDAQLAQVGGAQVDLLVCGHSTGASPQPRSLLPPRCTAPRAPSQSAAAARPGSQEGLSGQQAQLSASTKLPGALRGATSQLTRLQSLTPSAQCQHDEPPRTTPHPRKAQGASLMLATHRISVHRSDCLSSSVSHRSFPRGCGDSWALTPR